MKIGSTSTDSVSWGGTGQNFMAVLTVPVPPSSTNGGLPWCRGGDPSMAFDSQGRLFISYLARPSDNTTCPPNGTAAATGREVFVAGYQLNGGAFGLIPGVNWPVAATATAGFGVTNNGDKNWLAADSNPGSPFADQLYLVWAHLGPTVGNEWEIMTTSATAAGQWQDWSGAIQLTSTDDDAGGDADGLPDDGQRPWPPHVAVAPNGDIYVTTHFQMNFFDTGQRSPDGTSGDIMLWRSSNGGASYGAPSFPFPQSQADSTWNVQSLPNGVIPGFTAWNQGGSQGWVLPDTLTAGRVHVVAADDPDDDPDTGDPSDIFIVTSDDNGQTWGAPIRVDSGPMGTFQVMPTAAIDPVTGAIGVTYYDNRQGNTSPTGSGNFLLDLVSTFSTDGGQTWSPEAIVNDAQFNPDNTPSTRFCGPNDGTCPGCTPPGCPVTTRIGEYNGIAYGECTAYMVWADNPVCGAGLDTLFDLDPEMGGDLTFPAQLGP